MSSYWRVWLVSVAACLAFAAPAHASGPAETVYAIENSDGEAVGWQVERRSSGPGWSSHEVERKLAYSIDGHDEVETHYRSVARFEGSELVALDLAQTADGNARTVRLSVSSGIATIEGQQERAQALPDLPFLDTVSVERREGGTYLVFDPGSRRFEPVTLAYADDGNGRVTAILLAGDNAIDARRFTYLAGQSDAPLVTLPRFGAPLAFRKVASPGQLPDLSRRSKISHPLLESPYYIAPGTRDGHIRYRVFLPEMLAGRLPQTGEQRVTTGEPRLRIDVCEGCGPGLPTDEAYLEAMRKPAPWLQSAAPEIVGPAQRQRRRASSEANLMERLSKLARGRLRTIDFAGHYSALSAWKRRRGDCTEDAVLLAALARAAGIPALVASGVTYSRDRYHGVRDAFMPHSWVVAYTDDEWRSYDMTEGRFDSTHIALTLGEGDADSIAAAYVIGGLLEWESISEVRPRPEGDD